MVDKKKNTGAAPDPPAGATPLAGAATGAAPAEEAKKTRNRSAVSTERRLALLLAALVAFCDVNKLAGEPLENARAAAAEITNAVIKPVKDRLAVLRGELKALDMETASAAIVKDLVAEIARLETKLKTIEAQAKG